MESRGITPNDIENITSHVLYCKGNAHTPERFWIWALYSKSRPIPVEQLEKDGYIERDIEKLVNKYDGISWDCLNN